MEDADWHAPFAPKIQNAQVVIPDLVPPAAGAKTENVRQEKISRTAMNAMNFRA